MLRFLGLIILVFATTAPLFGQTQTIKRKYRGIYEGTIPNYEVRMGQEMIAVKATNMRVYLDRDSVYFEIGTYRYNSSYRFEKSSVSLLIGADRENSGIPEQLILDPKTKTMIRKGLYPQPDATLTRSGKLPRR
ncbi:MAG: hypothetical protein RIR94_1676 [Bacteroidota bacterium]